MALEVSLSAPAEPIATAEPVTPDPVVPDAAATTAAAATAPAKPSLEDSLAPLDEDTRKYVLGEMAKARREAGDARTAAKQKAAEDARAELAQQIGKAIGLVQDEAPDPAALTQQLAAQTDAARQSQVELAVYRAATAVGAEPAALLDSRSFMASLKDVDPADPAAVTAAITAAAEANPALRVTPTRRAPAATPALGSSAAGAPSLDDQIAVAKKAGDMRLALHLENQKLTAPSRQ